MPNGEVENQPEGSENQQEEGPDTTEQPKETERNNTEQQQEGRETEDFVIDKIVNHRVNRSRNHEYAKYGENLYPVRWYGFKPQDDTWEPTEHLPRSKILTYLKSKKLGIPNSIDAAIDG